MEELMGAMLAVGGFFFVVIEESCEAELEEKKGVKELDEEGLCFVCDRDQQARHSTKESQL